MFSHIVIVKFKKPIIRVFLAPQIRKELQNFRTIIEKKYPGVIGQRPETEDATILLMKIPRNRGNRAVGKFGLLTFVNQEALEIRLGESIPAGENITKWIVGFKEWAFAAVDNQIVPGILVSVNNIEGFWLAEDQFY